MTKTDQLRQTIEPSFKKEDIDFVCGLLKEIFIDNRENYNQFSPSSRSFIKRYPGRKMANMVQNYGFKLASEGVVLERDAYVFDAKTINPDQTPSTQKIVIDYWKRKVYPEES